MHPEHANLLGNVHGGWIMKLVDEAGALACMRHAQRRVVTVATACVGAPAMGVTGAALVNLAAVATPGAQGLLAVDYAVTELKEKGYQTVALFDEVGAGFEVGAGTVERRVESFHRSRVGAGEQLLGLEAGAGVGEQAARDGLLAERLFQHIHTAGPRLVEAEILVHHVFLAARLLVVLEKKDAVEVEQRRRQVLRVGVDGVAEEDELDERDADHRHREQDRGAADAVFQQRHGQPNRLLDLGAARLREGADDGAAVAPEYVTMPRGVTAAAGEVTWLRARP